MVKPLDLLQELTSDNPQQQAGIVTLRELTGKKLDELGQTVAMARAGQVEAARSLVLSDKGLLLMTEIHNILGQMQSEEIRLNAERTATYEKSVATTILCVYLATGVAALGLVFLGYYILHEMELRRWSAQPSYSSDTALSEDEDGSRYHQGLRSDANDPQRSLPHLQAARQGRGAFHQ